MISVNVCFDIPMTHELTTLCQNAGCKFWIRLYGPIFCIVWKYTST